MALGVDLKGAKAAAASAPGMRAKTRLASRDIAFRDHAARNSPRLAVSIPAIQPLIACPIADA